MAVLNLTLSDVGDHSHKLIFNRELDKTDITVVIKGSNDQALSVKLNSADFLLSLKSLFPDLKIFLNE